MSEILYRFGIVTTAALGNGLRYESLRKYADRFAAGMNVECVWSPVKHYRDAEPFPFLPGGVRTRLAAWEQTKAVRQAWARLDAVLFHYNEPYIWQALARPRRGAAKPRLIWAGDAPPNADPDHYPVYTVKTARWRQRVRFAIDRYCAERTDYFLPWSEWSARCLTQACGVEETRMTVIAQYLDLETWRPMPHPVNPLPRLLFVGGDFERKGGRDLLHVFANRFIGRAELHLVTRSQKFALPPGVFLHTGLTHENGALQELYARADIFVLPTCADFSPAVIAEAMATGRAVIAGNTGGVADMVRHNETGIMVTPKDHAALAQAIETLITNADLRRRMGDAGRRRAACEFSAEINARRMLEAMVYTTHAHRVTGKSVKEQNA